MIRGLGCHSGVPNADSLFETECLINLDIDLQSVSASTDEGTHAVLGVYLIGAPRIYNILFIKDFGPVFPT